MFSLFCQITVTKLKNRIFISIQTGVWKLIFQFSYCASKQNRKQWKFIVNIDQYHEKIMTNEIRY